MYNTARKTVPSEAEVVYRSEEARELTDYWFQLARETGSIPPKSAFNPVAIRNLLPAVMLIERPEPDAYYMRLQGTAFRSRNVKDTTGTQASRDPSSKEDVTIFDALDSVLDTPCCVRLIGLEQGENGRLALVEFVGFPLTDTDGTIRFVVAIAAPLETLGYEEMRDFPVPLVEIREITEISLDAL